MLRYCIVTLLYMLRYCIVTLLYMLRYCVTPSIADIHSSNYHCHFLNWMSVRVVSYLNVVHLLTYSTFLWTIFVTRLKDSAKNKIIRKEREITICVGTNQTGNITW